MDKQAIASQTISQIQQKIKESGIAPNIFSSFGNMAKQAITDKALYPLIIDQLKKYKLIDPNEVPPGIDYKALSWLIVIGKAADLMQGKQL